MLTVCVPVLRRYDLLKELFESLEAGILKPSRVLVVDNGQKLARDKTFSFPVEVFTPNVPMGVAEAWNWFIRNTKGERLIANDDIVFGMDSLARMVERPEAFVSCTFGFACFLLRDACVERVGFFDETISPGYAYFEDRDYYNRMKEVNLVDAVVDCGVEHRHSQTIAAFTPAEMKEHHRKFVVAQENFLRKWGKLPDDLRRQTA